MIINVKLQDMTNLVENYLVKKTDDVISLMCKKYLEKGKLYIEWHNSRWWNRLAIKYFNKKPVEKSWHNISLFYAENEHRSRFSLFGKPKNWPEKKAVANFVLNRIDYVLDNKWLYKSRGFLAANEFDVQDKEMTKVNLNNRYWNFIFRTQDDWKNQLVPWTNEELTYYEWLLKTSDRKSQRILKAASSPVVVNG